MKLGIVGSEFVGAYALGIGEVGHRVALVYQNPRRVEADDILHAVPFAHPDEVAAGDGACQAEGTLCISCPCLGSEVIKSNRIGRS